MAALGAGDDGEVLLFGLLGEAEHLADAGPVDGDGLLAEDVLAGPDRRFEVLRAEARRRGQDHQIDAGIDHLLIGVEADEGSIGRDLHLSGMRAVFAVLRVGEVAGGGRWRGP